jgi:4-hydroxy-3-polyprenylbenzoate decarboxylase
MVASGCGAIARNGRYVVIVDEDIDVSSLQEVVWAMMTRVDPATDIQIFDNAWATPLDPRMPPDVAAQGPHTNSRAIFYAVRPWAWRDKFPKVNRIDADQRESVLQKYADVFNFPKR